MDVKFENKNISKLNYRYDDNIKPNRPRSKYSKQFKGSLNHKIRRYQNSKDSFHEIIQTESLVNLLLCFLTCKL